MLQNGNGLKVNFSWSFIPWLAPFNEASINVSKPHDVNSIDRFSELRKWMVIKQMISVSGYTKVPYGWYYSMFERTWTRKVAKASFPSLALSNYTGKAIDIQCFFKLTAAQNQRTNMKQKMIQKFFKVQK